jgi:hypothetical protein
MLGVMYTINKDASGVTLTCNECSHTVRVNEFDDRLGSRRHAGRSCHVEAGSGQPLALRCDRWIAALSLL